MTPTEYAQLPAGWVWATFGDLLSEPLANGLSIKGSETPPGVPALKLNAMGERGFDWTKVRYLPIDWDEVSGLEIQEGDFFISRGNGSLALVGRGTSAQKPAQRVIFPDTMIRARICEPIRSTGWVQTVWSCPGVREQIEKRVKTTAGIWKISQGEIESIKLPIPPVSEQIRIVGEVEKQLTRLDAGVEALKRVQVQLKRYRASTLKAACEGRLVPTEAELARREKRDYEPADKLLARILQERRARWEADQLTKMKASGKPPKDEKWKAKYTEPDGLTEAQKTQLPEGWTWTTLGQAFRVAVGATPSRGEPSFWKGAIPWVSSGEVSFCRIRATRETITEAGLANSSTELHPQGTVLLGMIGEGKTRGQVAVLEIVACNNQNSAAIRVSEAGLPPEYVYRYLEGQYAQTRRVGSGNNQQALNKSKVEAMPIPLPPLAEQRRIALEVERLLSNVDNIESFVALNVARSSKMRQSILRQAFDGLLVPQDPRDEPASRFLERVSASVANKPVPKQGRAKQTTAVPKMKAPR